MKSVVKWLICLVFSPWVQAGVLDIKASYMPSSLNPGHVKFTNTTPLSGYCSDWPGRCLPGTFSITLPFTIDRTWAIPGALESHNYQRIDGAWKTVWVQNTASGESVPVRFRLNVVSRRYLLGALQPGGVPGSIGQVVNQRAAISGNCAQTIVSGNSILFEFGWTIPEGLALCSRAAIAEEAMGPYAGSIDKISIGYELETPNPLLMSNGIYTGSVDYSVGAGKQIDLGNGAYTDSNVQLNFELTVLHELRIDFPAGSERAVLEPRNGWDDWLNRGRAPARLYREHPFQIWASAPMKIYLRCNDYQIGHRCAMQRDGSTEQVAFDVALSLPGTIRYQGGEVQGLSLPVGEASALEFVSIAPTYNRQGRLLYEVAKEDVATMLKHGGSTWRGDVTIVFDAQL